MSATRIAATLLFALAGVVHAGDLEHRSAMVAAKLARTANRELEVKQSLHALASNKALLGALKQSGDTIELGHLESTGTRGRLVFSRSVWGFAGNRVFQHSVNDTVHSTSKLMLTSKGLEVHEYERVAPVTKASVTAYRHALDAAYGRADLGNLREGLDVNVKLEQAPMGPQMHVGMQPVHVSGLFGRGQKLDLNTWSELDLSSVDRAIEAWAKK